MPKQDNFPEVFRRLRAIMQECAPGLSLKADTADNFYLDVPPSVKYPKGISFGAVQIKKNYVSYHLVPVYMFPTLLDNLSAPLKKRMQGKGCFNFTNVDETLFAELKQLTEAGIASFREA